MIEVNIFNYSVVAVVPAIVESRWQQNTTYEDQIRASKKVIESQSKPIPGSRSG